MFNAFIPPFLFLVNLFVLGTRYLASVSRADVDDFQVDLILMTDIRGPDRGFVSPPVHTFTSLLLLLLLSFLFLVWG